MAITNGYTTLNELKALLEIGVTDTDDDTPLESAVETASRMIDRYCERRFFVVEETRYYKAEYADMLVIDDLVSLTGLWTDSTGNRSYDTEWGASDYDLEPGNAPLDGKPYTEIWVAPDSTAYFPINLRRGVKLTGEFGYGNTVPIAVADACLLQAARLFRRRDAIFGASGPATLGQVTVNVGGNSPRRPALDPDVQLILADVRRGKDMVLGV